MPNGESSALEELPNHPTPMLSIDWKSGVIKSINPRLLVETDIADSAAFVGHNISEFLPNITQEELRSLFSQTTRFALAHEARKNYPHPELHLQLSNDKHMTVELASQAIYDPHAATKTPHDIIGFTSMLFDVTDRTKDPLLTDLLNKRTFYKAAQRLLSAQHRAGHSVTTIMVDIDHFKSVNDRFSHNAGDKVLQGITQLLLDGTRTEMDILGRVGGEEFGVVQPEMEQNNAVDAAERLRKAVETTQFRVNETTFPLTISIGLSIYSAKDNTSDIESFLHNADLALTAVKQTGRNGIGVFERSPEGNSATIKVLRPDASGALTITDVFDVVYPQAGLPQLSDLKKRDSGVVKQDL